MFPPSLDGNMRFRDPEDLGPIPFVETLGRRLHKAHARDIHLRPDGLSFRGGGTSRWSPLVMVRCGTVSVAASNEVMIVRYTLRLPRIALGVVVLFAVFAGLVFYGVPPTPSAGRGILGFLFVLAWFGGVNMLLTYTRFRGILKGAWRDARSQGGT